MGGGVLLCESGWEEEDWAGGGGCIDSRRLAKAPQRPWQLCPKSGRRSRGCDRVKWESLGVRLRDGVLTGEGVVPLMELLAERFAI